MTKKCNKGLEKPYFFMKP